MRDCRARHSNTAVPETGRRGTGDSSPRGLPATVRSWTLPTPWSRYTTKPAPFGPHRSGRGRSAVSTSPTPFGCMICATPGRHSPCGPGTRTGGRWSSRCYRREPPRRRRRLERDRPRPGPRCEFERSRSGRRTGQCPRGASAGTSCRIERGRSSGARDACRQRRDDNRAGRVGGSRWRSVADKPAEPVAALVRHEPVGPVHDRRDRHRRRSRGLLAGLEEAQPAHDVAHRPRSQEPSPGLGEVGLREIGGVRGQRCEEPGASEVLEPRVSAASARMRSTSPVPLSSPPSWPSPGSGACGLLVNPWGHGAGRKLPADRGDAVAHHLGDDEADTGGHGP